MPEIAPARCHQRFEKRIRDRAFKVAPLITLGGQRQDRFGWPASIVWHQITGTFVGDGACQSATDRPESLAMFKRRSTRGPNGKTAQVDTARKIRA